MNTVKENLKDISTDNLETKISETYNLIINKSQKIAKLTQVVLSYISQSENVFEVLSKTNFEIIKYLSFLQGLKVFSEDDSAFSKKNFYLGRIYQLNFFTLEVFGILVSREKMTNGTYQKINKNYQIIFSAISYFMDLNQVLKEKKMISGFVLTGNEKEKPSSKSDQMSYVIENLLSYSDDVKSDIFEPFQVREHRAIPGENKGQNNLIKNVLLKNEPTKGKKDDSIDRIVEPGIYPLNKNSEIIKRQAEIQNLLRKEGKLTIAQVAEHFKGCSEKTIQRDLNSLIKKGQVARIGQKRWSQYTLS